MGTHHFLETVTLHKPTEFKMELDLHSWLEFCAYHTDGYENDTTNFLVSCFRDRGHFLDVGANIGLISIPFSMLVRSSMPTNEPFVSCIEAVRSNHRRLSKNIVMNGLVSVVNALQYGVAERQKTVEIQVEGNLMDGEGTGTANVLAEDADHPCERISMDVTTIDHLVQESKIPKEVSLVKFDLDGYDLKACQGARELLSSARPVVFGEFNAYCMHWHGQTRDDVKEYMKELDYDIFVRRKGSFTFSRNSSSDGDLLILPRERVPEFNWCCQE